MNSILPRSNDQHLLERILLHAGHHHQQGHMQAAQDFLELATLISPANTDYIAAYGSVCGQAGHWTQARDAFSQLVQLKPHEADSWIRLASACQKLEDQDAFMKSLQKALDADPTHPVAIKMLAVLELTRREYASAARLYYILLQRNADDIDNLLGLAKCFYKLNDLPSARMVFEQILQLDPANELAREGLSIVDNSGPPGPPGCELGSHSALVPDHSREPPIPEAHPATAPPPSLLLSLESTLTQIHQLLAQADSAQASAKPQQAIAALQQAATLAPNAVSIWSSLGSLQYLQGDLLSAATAFDRAIQLNSQDPILHVQKAMVLLKLGQIESFEHSLSTALNLDPNCQPALKLLGDLNFDCKRFSQAASVYSNLLRLNPANIDVLLRLGKCQYQLSNVQEAIHCYQQVAALEPNNPIAQEALGILLAPTVQSAESACVS